MACRFQRTCREGSGCRLLGRFRVRFPQILADAFRQFCCGAEHVLLARGVVLPSDHGFASRGIERRNIHSVAAALLSDGAGNDNADAFAHGDELRERRVHMRRARPQFSSIFLRLPAIERRNKRSAFERHTHHRFEGAVKNGVSRFVVKVRNKNAD